MKKFVLISVIAIALFSCKKDKSKTPEVVTTTTPPPMAVSFATEVKPIFIRSCGTGGSCHGTANAARGYVFETHAGASAVNDVLVLGAIKHKPGFFVMPKNLAKLPDTEIAIIEAWINGGKQNN